MVTSGKTYDAEFRQVKFCKNERNWSKAGSVDMSKRFCKAVASTHSWYNDVTRGHVSLQINSCEFVCGSQSRNKKKQSVDIMNCEHLELLFANLSLIKLFSKALEALSIIRLLLK